MNIGEQSVKIWKLSQIIREFEKNLWEFDIWVAISGGEWCWNIKQYWNFVFKIVGIDQKLHLGEYV